MRAYRGRRVSVSDYTRSIHGRIFALPSYHLAHIANELHGRKHLPSELAHAQRQLDQKRRPA